MRDCGRRNVGNVEPSEFKSLRLRHESPFRHFRALLGHARRRKLALIWPFEISKTKGSRFSIGSSPARFRSSCCSSGRLGRVGKSWRRRCLDPRFTRSLGSGVVLSDRVVNGAHRRRSSPHAASRPPAPAVRPSAVGPTGRGLSRRAVAAGGEEALHCRSQDTADELDPKRSRYSSMNRIISVRGGRAPSRKTRSQP